MKALVTGGRGFIGSNLVDELIKRGWELHTVDDLSAVTHESFYSNPRAVNHEENICNLEKLKNIFEENRFDVVFHLAARSRIQPTIGDPTGTCHVNTVGTCNVLQCAKESGVGRLVYSSTSSVYGLKNESPLKEDMQVDCLNPYSISKYSGELLSKMYYNLFGLETVILRYFNVYGPREPVRGIYAPVIGRFLKQHKNGEEMTVVGDGNQTRDFTHVKDVVLANIFSAESDREGVLGETFNVGAGRSCSVLDLTDMIGGSKRHLDPRPAEAEHTLADIQKSRQLLGWVPTLRVEDYIKKQLT